ncbi:LOW QUALITY PROTEIN: urotensin-2 [Natator depressus]|uniref:LOW QUALITY PROTEIN: urotensin-2 n=1 Tax=Natator depressus TaxID=27790 RepID=UPI003EBFD6FB
MSGYIIGEIGRRSTSQIAVLCDGVNKDELYSAATMHTLVFCCLFIISLSCPLLSLPIIDSSEVSYQLSADENTRLNVERLDSLGRASLLQTLPRLLGAQTEDSPSKAGLSPSSYNPRENVKEAFYGSHPQIALLSRLLAKDRKQNKKRGNLSECFWKYCV